MNSKQALSEQEYYKLWHKAHGPAFQGLDSDPSSELWQMLEPHLKGEFPREAVQLLKDLAGLTTSSKINYTAEAVELSDRAKVPGIMRLWSGMETNIQDCKCSCHVENEVNFITHCTSCQPKPVCQTCGGSERIHHCFGHQRPGTVEDCSICNMGDSEPCPDCTEKDACAIISEVIRGETHTVQISNMSEPQLQSLINFLGVSPHIPLGPVDIETVPGTPKPKDVIITEEDVFVDQRKGERRIKEFEHGWVDDPKQNGVFSMEIYSLDKGETWRPDRREGDRRSKILAGSLKAMRPQ